MKSFLAKTLIGSIIFISAFGMVVVAVPRTAQAQAPAGAWGMGGQRDVDAVENAKALEKQVGPEPKGCVGFRYLPPGPTVNPIACFAMLANWAMWVSARVLWIAGILLNYSMSYTLNMNPLLADMPVVDIGWKIIRDISN